ncbi:outer membrane beta-barrel protein [Mucilaginibacter polytrichastri]|uniref:Outer membrane protein beta-barrel domain-containing protein n=1 Tax=Mucilaginibacter polytrichastri TaxID=1302689 RepID=A0A1Q6A0S4_9SPHI|nr:outer membrane beta-barrel protein [Mucilaginibacter polytrichastri]OKS87606.1 hypothetical protein RG47T_3067 [Mucilaginibacter polytrichastri]
MLLLIQHAAFAQTEKFAERFYFPGGVGYNIVNSDAGGIAFKNGISINTGAEYRPHYINAVFYRFNFDVLNSSYTKNNIIATNVTNGKFTSNCFVIGAGYRFKYKGWGIYALGQSGLINHGYEKVNSYVNNEITVSSATQHNAIFKMAGGIEYYIVPHFALVFEPSYYQNLSTKSNLTPSFFNFNIGLTTTLF